MAYACLYDECNGDAKLLALSDAAHRMYTCGLVYVNKHLTDGFIPDHAIETFGVRAKNKRKVAEELCTVLVPGKSSLWHRVEGGYQVHDHRDWNDTREAILAKRQRSAERVNRFRARLSTGTNIEPCNALQGALPTPFATPLDTAFETTDPRTTSTRPPQSPPRGAGLSRPRELRKRAQEIRTKAWGRCQHEPPCDSYAACIVRIVEHLQHRELEALRDPEPQAVAQ